MGMTPRSTGASEDDTPQSRGPHFDFEVALPAPTGEALESSQSACEPPGQDMRAMLEPLPPGWVQGQGFIKGLRPSADVFDDRHNEDYSMNQDHDMGQYVNVTGTEDTADKNPQGTPRSHNKGHDDVELLEGALQQSACDNRDDTTNGDPAAFELGDEPLCENRAPSLPRSPGPHGEAHPEAPTSPVSSEDPLQAEVPLPGDSAASASAAAGVPEPAGSPPRLSEAQRRCLYQLLGQRDADGRAVYNLDAYRTDQEKWDAYRKAVREEYRAYRKRKRADGTWEKDDHRWRTPHGGPGRQAPPERPPLPRSRDRSPLPRRRTSSTGRPMRGSSEAQ